MNNIPHPPDAERQGRQASSHDTKIEYAIRLESCSDFARSAGTVLTPQDLLLLTETFLLPVYGTSDSQWVLAEDLRRMLPIVKQQVHFLKSEILPKTLFDDEQPSVISLGPNTELELGAWTSGVDPALYAAVRNLVQRAAAEVPLQNVPRRDVAYFPPIRLASSSHDVLEAANKQTENARLLGASRASEFANTASYMGSKKYLASFIVEALRSTLGDDGVVFDLMCGSGVVSGAASRFWPTIASDAQGFCRILAQVQGGGFTRAGAEQILSLVTPPAREHAVELKTMVAVHLDREDQLLHGEAREELVAQYIEYHRSFPLFPSEGAGSWQPLREVELRRRKTNQCPYLLFTAYFANIYIGLRQAVELDSLRYAIDLLNDSNHRRWALGALIATVSRLATTYGGHFAQPLTSNLDKLTYKDVTFLVEQRRYSIFHEFSVRLLNLAEESEKVRYPVRAVTGPWQKAIADAQEVIGVHNAVVYLDPPYRREEYSRYYHLLETLTSYSYPSVQGTGRTPDKRTGERFSSEFFTRNKTKMAQQLAAIISQVLQRGWTCAWSYASSSDAEIKDVLDLVTASHDARIWSVAAPHEHHGHGGRKPKQVTEYLLFLTVRS
jgi:adenine-specific DNA-methyltransferase